MTINNLIEDAVIIALPLTRSLYVGVIDAAAAFCLVTIIDEHLIGFRYKQFSVD